MKSNNKNSAEQYFNQKDFSVIEIILLILAVISVFVMIFVRGGIPMGLPIFAVSAIVLCVLRSFKVKDADIDQMLAKIIQDNSVERAENVIECYDLKNTVVRKRKDGKIISSKYCITNIKFSSEATVFTVYNIDLINQTVEKTIHTVACNVKITLTGETLRTDVGSVSVSYIDFDSFTIPVTLKEYKTAELVQKVCDRHN